MKKIFLLASIMLAVAVLSACSVVQAPGPVEEETTVEGRIIDMAPDDYVLIRNEEDTSIYYKIDISGGITAATGVSDDLEPNNVISARVFMRDDQSIPMTAELVSIVTNESPSYKVIGAEEAKKMMDEGNVIILDVRTNEEYQSGYIPDAFNLPLGTIEEGIDKIATGKQDVILVYCRSGNRSKVAARELTELGYENVYDFGGIIDWPYEVVEP